MSRIWTGWNGKKIPVLVIEADEEKKRLVLSGRELAREKQDAEKKSRIARCETGAIMEGTVETIKPYGAFVLLENGLSGLVHVSQMSKKRVENPGAVVKVGQKVTVKILSTANGKLSLSMKEVERTKRRKRKYLIIMNQASDNRFASC